MEEFVNVVIFCDGVVGARLEKILCVREKLAAKLIVGLQPRDTQLRMKYNPVADRQQSF